MLLRLVVFAQGQVRIPIVFRIAASTSGWSVKRPSMRCAARSSTVRSLMSRSGS